MSSHYFNTEIAKEYGIEEAIILQNILYWIEKNTANENSFHDGTYWTYNSIRAFSTLFEYMSTSTIRRSLKNLELSGLILTGNYNKAAYDRTQWYALTDKGIEKTGTSILQKWQMDVAKSANQFAKSSKPIPNINTDKKSNNKQNNNYADESIFPDSSSLGNQVPSEENKRFKKPTIDEIAAYCKERSNTVNPEKFFNYYETNGWKVGKNCMKNWKAAIRTWELNEKSFSGQSSRYYPSSKSSSAGGYVPRAGTIAASGGSDLFDAMEAK